MGVRVRLSRNTSVYMPFWVAIPVWIMWACVMAAVLVIIGLVKLTRLIIIAIAARHSA